MKKPTEEHPVGGLYIVAEPKSPWKRTIYAFHFHGAPVEAEWKALETVRASMPEGRWNVWRSEQGEDGIESRTPSYWPRRPVKWMCFKWEPKAEPYF